MANLPIFGDRRGDAEYLGRPGDDRLQAIVPAYTFNCTGRVTEWRACVQQGDGGGRYYIQFQVWRPTGVPGCYTLVGYNTPPVNQLLRPAGLCVQLLATEGEQIQFQPDDVVGYYVNWFDRNGRDRSGGGIQVISDSAVTIYNVINVPPSGFQTQYAIPALSSSALPCESPSMVLSDSADGAPIINLNISAAVTDGIRSTDVPRILSKSILLSTATIPSPTPTSLTSTPPVPFGAHSSSTATITIVSFSPCASIGSDCSICASIGSECSICTSNGSDCSTSCSGGCADSTSSLLNKDSVFVGVGVACALLVLITAAVIIATVLAYLWRRKKGLNMVDNAAYNFSTKDENMYSNMMYMAGSAHIPILPNQAYTIANYNKETCETPTSTDSVYQEVQCDNGAYDYPRPE